jgi:hypothetical protein
MIVFGFCFGTARRAIMFVVATSKTSSYSLGMWYWPVLSLSFLDVYWAADIK